MYLSKLTLNPRSRFARVDLASPHQMHKTIMRAFPDADDGGPGRVLFRVDRTKDEYDQPIPIVLVQSDKEPDWSRLTRVPEYGGYAHVEKPKEFDAVFPVGRRFVFRLRANPTVKRIISTDDGEPVLNRKGKPKSARHGLFTEEQQEQWIQRKADAGGFHVLTCRTIPEPTVQDTIKKNAHLRRRATFHAVRFEGVLEVTDPETFRNTVQAGIGSAKGMGFGLLSITPVRTE